MCGVVGAFAFRDTSTAELIDPVRQLVTRMARRGPDDEGSWTDHRRCAFGFRRLSILDLTPAGHQPMTTADARFTLVFNGEIYNYRELRDELEGRGRIPRSTGDAEVLLLALQEWGADALRRLDGMFALAFYDARDQTLLLARDHAGIKPLYVGTSARGVVFGSQYDQLLAHPWLRDAAVDRAAVARYLRLGFVLAPHGLHQGLGQLQPGEWRTFDRDGVTRAGRFFELPQQPTATLSGIDAIDALDAALSRSIRRHLIADVPVGVLLSGGVDSGLVAAEAARQAGGDLHAFTIGVDDPSMDEVAEAGRLAREIGVRHVVQRITAHDALGLVEDVVAACTEPTADYSVFPMLMVSRLARQHVKVVLSGDGGDELYWGYPSRFGSAIRLARYFAWPRGARALAVGARRAFGVGAATRDVLAYSSVGRLYQRKHTLIPEADLGAMFPVLAREHDVLDEFVFDGTCADDVARWTRWNELYVHLARVLAKVDRASMYHSLEVRVPLLDKAVIETAWSTDWRSCLDLQIPIGKLPLRAALARRTGVRSPGKKGFTVPMHAWLAGPLRGLAHAHLADRRALLGIELEPRALRAMLQRIDAGDRSKAWGVWSLLALSLWEQRHGRAS